MRKCTEWLEAPNEPVLFRQERIGGGQDGNRGRWVAKQYNLSTSNNLTLFLVEPFTGRPCLHSHQVLPWTGPLANTSTTTWA